MKIAIPLEENKRDVCIVMARTLYFLIREDGTDTILENPAAKASGGAGMQAAQFLVDNGIDVLITTRCGQNAAEVFSAAGIRLMRSQNAAAADDIAEFLAGELSPLVSFHGGYHGIV